LTQTVKLGYANQFKTSYVDLLTDVVKELLNEDKKQHLQTYGYVLEKSIPSETDVPSDSILDKFSSTHYVK
jgi:hypothetical protein